MKIIKKILLCLLYITTLLMIYNIIKLNILNNLYISIIIALTVIINIIISLLLLIKNKVISIIIILLSLLLILGNIIGTIYINSTKNYLHTITNNKNKLYEKTYQVVVLKNTYNKIKELNNKSIGLLTIDSNKEENIKELNKNITIESKEYNDISTLYISLHNKEIDALSIDKSYLETLKEENYKLLENTKVIYTYKLKTKEEKNTTPIDLTPNKKPYIIYISGSDSRTTVKDIARSDVNIIMTVNPQKHKILLVSIPRDYYVQLSGTTGTKDKLTHAGVYGINKSITTIEDLLDIKINDYIKVSFATVIKSVDLLDGIDIYSDKSFTPYTNKKCYITEGTQHLNGTCALAFARERKTYERGDRHRGENQEQVLSKMIEKMTEPKYLIKYNEILKQTENSFETSITYDNITNMVKEELTTLASWNIETYNLDGEGAMLPTYSMGSMNLWVMIPDQTTVDTAKTKIKEYLEIDEK